MSRTTVIVVAVAIVLVGFLVWLLLTLTQQALDHDGPDDTEPTEQIRPDLRIVAIPPLTSTTTTAPPPPLTTTTRHAAALRGAPVGELQDLIRVGFARFGPAVAEEAVRVAGCESTGDETGQNLDPGAINGPHAGLFQLSRTYHEERARRLGFTWDQMFEAGPNIAVAADLYAEKRRWSPTWSCAWAA